MKPEFLSGDGSLRSEAANAKTRLNVAPMSSPWHDLHQRHHGTGLKKVQATNRSARLVHAAISAIVRLEVFEARWCRTQARSSLNSASSAPGPR